MTTIRRLALLAAALLACISLAMAEPQATASPCMASRPCRRTSRTCPMPIRMRRRAGSCGRRSPAASTASTPSSSRARPAPDVRTYVFESLLGRNWDEPFSLYGLLAETIDVSDDRQTFTFKLRPEAKFSDGTPVTAADVVFSMETLRDKGRPNFKNSYAKIRKVETPDERTIVFHSGGGRPRVAADRRRSCRSFQGLGGQGLSTPTTLDPIMGSGPYVIARGEGGRDHHLSGKTRTTGARTSPSKGPVELRRGALRLLPRCQCRLRGLQIGPGRCPDRERPDALATGYDFPAVKDGKVTLEKVEQKSPAPAVRLRLQHPAQDFEDLRVREALVMAFDFEWANANLFSGAYSRTYGYYSGSELSSQGKPADEREKAVLGDAAASCGRTSSMAAISCR